MVAKVWAEEGANLRSLYSFWQNAINPVCGVVQLDRRTFSTWNAIGGIIWTEVAIGVGYLLGDVLGNAANYYLYGVVGVIVLISLVPMLVEIFREWQSKRYMK